MSIKAICNACAGNGGGYVLEHGLKRMFTCPICQGSGEVNANSIDDGSRREEALRRQIRADVINSPETADFMAAVPLEAAHARERWGPDHDEGKTAWDWFWLVGYLVQKAAAAHDAGDLEKAKHHTISTAAALANWHARLSGSDDGRYAPGLSEEPVQ